MALYGGDWRHLSAALDADGRGGNAFDLVLSAETAYREDTAAALVAAIAATLAPGGIALVATKRYYFGCGGGVAALDAALAATALERRVVWSAEDGKSNVRDILELTWAAG